MADPRITKLETIAFTYKQTNIGADYYGFNLCYQKGAVHTAHRTLLFIHTDVGVTGFSPEISPLEEALLPWVWPFLNEGKA